MKRNIREEDIALYVIRCLAIYLLKEEHGIQVLVNAGIIKELGLVLSSSNEKLRKEAIWCLSNITASKPIHVQVVIDSGILKQIVELTIKDVYTVKVECIWVLANAAYRHNTSNVKYLIDIDVVEALCSMLNIKDLKILYVTIQGILYLLKGAKEKLDEVKERIKKCEGLDLLERLQYHENQYIYRLVYEIIENYFYTKDIFDDIICSLCIQ